MTVRPRISTDVECSNGVVHVIDAVLLPPAEAQGNAECRDLQMNIST